MNPHANTGHATLDSAIIFLKCMGSICSILIAEWMPELTILLHLHLPPVLLELTQLIAWAVGITAGTLTIFNIIGYNPAWLQNVKQKAKKL